MYYFNPRPREEGDLKTANATVSVSNISIHALVKRATALLFKLSKMYFISIHALVKRATYKKIDVFLPI